MDTETDTEVAELCTVALVDLVLDPTLQMREAVDPTVAKDYAAALADGAVFPPIEVWNVVGELLVVDGWHRVEAHRIEGRDTIVAMVCRGTRREAFAAAIGANATHGKSRTHEDKRRAVLALLRDSEWCMLASRPLGKIAGVSRTFINNERARFGIRRGELLTDERLEDVEGQPPPAWARLLEATPSLYHSQIRAVRVARGLVDLDRLQSRHPPHTGIPAAVDLRLHELAGEAYPHPEESPEERRARVQGADTVDELEQLLAAKGTPDRPIVWKAWRHARAVESADLPTVEALLDDDAFAGRPGLQEDARRRRDELRAVRDAKPPSKWERARKIETQDADTQVEELAELDDELLDTVDARELADEARDVLRKRDEERFDQVEECPDPLCDGWARPGAFSAQLSCTVCKRTPAVVRDALEVERARFARLVVDGYQVGDFLINAAAVNLLDAIRRDRGPEELQHNVERYRASLEG